MPLKVFILKTLTNSKFEWMRGEYKIEIEKKNKKMGKRVKYIYSCLGWSKFSCVFISPSCYSKWKLTLGS